jgi:uncharacterized sulfatase
MLHKEDSAIRYWAAMGLLVRPAVLSDETVRAALRAAMDDKSKNVQVLAAEALGRFGANQDLPAAVERLVELSNIEKHGLYVSMFALNSLDQLNEKASGAADEIRALPKTVKSVPQRLSGYVPRLLEEVVRDL